MKYTIGNKFLVILLAILNGSIFCDTNVEESDINMINDQNFNSLQKESNKHAIDGRKSSKKRHHWEQTNFIITDFLSDGEMERRLSLDGVAAKETSLGNGR